METVLAEDFFGQLAERIANQSLAIFIVLAIMFFIDKRLWPWFTNTYWPSVQLREAKEEETISLLARSVQALEALLSRQEQNTVKIAERVASMEGKLEAHIRDATRAVSQIDSWESIKHQLTIALDRFSAKLFDGDIVVGKSKGDEK